ncbi:MAG: flagellin, partial [Spirochaetota bacterium]|nr:flagellin [Spirochaetota bacterium]
MVINHNLSAVNTHRHIKFNNLLADKHMQRLSSGMRINSAGDDASGLAVSEKMRSQIRGLNQAAKNISIDISFIQTTEGYLQTTQDLIHRLRELAVQSANGTYTSEDRFQIQVEVSQLIDEIDRVASHAQFNTMNMLTGRFASGREGTATASMWFHIGANMDQREKIHIGTMTAQALGMKSATGRIVNMLTQDNANRSIATFDLALFKVSKQRADLGAVHNRLEYALQGVMV